MKTSIKTAIIILVLVMASAIKADASNVSKRDRKAINAYVNSKYGSGYKVRIVKAEKLETKTLATRKGKKTVYIEQHVTISCGNYGIVKASGKFHGNVIYYSKPVRKGKTEKVYLIYSPYTNSLDGIAAIVNSGTIKG